MESVREKHMVLVCSCCLDRLDEVIYNKTAAETDIFVKDVQFFKS